jgi:hypothetical protein
VAERTPAAVLAGLVADLMSSPSALSPRLLGYVRNTVPTPDADYPWPAPKACFAVYLGHLLPAGDADVGAWLALDRAGPELSQRHWWPLMEHAEVLG